jgi:membrane protease YdiL (CAAX protease family)
MPDNDVPQQKVSVLPTSGLHPRDRFSTWSIVLIILIFVVQFVFNDGDALISKVLKKHHQVSGQAVSTDSFQQLVIIDMEVKQAYLTSLIPASMFSASDLSRLGAELHKHSPAHVAGQVPLNPFHRGLEDALDDSIDALRTNSDSIYFARRVILLRILLQIPPFEPISKTHNEPGLSSPLQAFNVAAKNDRYVAPHILQEEGFWRSNFGPELISKSHARASIAELSDFPTLLFYSQIAKQQLCLKAGLNQEALQINRGLQYRSAISILSMGGLSSIVGILLLVGLIVWVGFGSALWMQYSFAKADGGRIMGQPGLEPIGFVTVNGAEAPVVRGPSIFDRFLKPAPDLIAPGDRKLRAGDLLDCFALYLLLLTGLGTVIGLAAELVPTSIIERQPYLVLIYWNIGLTLISYIGASALALGIVKVKAKAVGTTLAIELGLSRKNAFKHIVFGTVGWGASLVLLIVVSTVSERVFNSFPAPANPALPMLAFAPNTICRFALYGMAAIAAPFFEETFFRGVLLNALLLRFKPGYACLIVGLMFGGIHPVGIAQALSLGALGVVFAWMAYVRKSLAPSMFAHFLQNSYAYLAVYFSFAVISRLF